MATSFGGVACNNVKGRANSKTTNIEVFTRPGTDGHGALDLGDVARPNDFTLVFFGTPAACETWVGQIEAKVGTLVAVEDDWGRTTASWLCMSIQSAKVVRADRGTGTAGARAVVRVKGATQ
jgi:hypothetical protein